MRKHEVLLLKGHIKCSNRTNLCASTCCTRSFENEEVTLLTKLGVNNLNVCVLFIKIYKG